MGKLHASVVVPAFAALVFVAQDSSPAPAGAFAQTATLASKPSFEVASVKPNNGPFRGSSLSTHPGGRFTAVNQTLAAIISYALAVEPSLIYGLPEWASSERFDIVAKAAQEFPRISTKPIISQLMVQSLLEERFRLVSHRETRELPAYALVLARADGRLGPQLKRSDIDCAALSAARGAGASPERASAPGERRPCGMTSFGGTWTGSAIPIPMLLGALSRAAHRMVVDRTGLNGAFDFDINFATEPADTTRPSVFTAVQEQLGLKLESVRVPMDALVIDNIERPTPD